VNTRTSVLTEDLLAIGRAAGLAAVGVADASVLEPARTVLQSRKRAGLAGEMQFTYRNPERSTDPSRVVPNARSLIAGAWSYQHLDRPSPADTPALAATVARYSWHDHYDDLEQALRPVADRLVECGYEARIVADTNALVDRNVAWSAGLGWYGKNSNLLLPDAGSWFVLGAVVTDAALDPTGPPLADGCGPCSQCIDDCPTDAIIAPGIVDATRCLAWIVQAGGAIPPEYRVAVGDRIYGCDDCQDVCPPNRSVDRLTIGSSRSKATRAETTRVKVETTRVKVDLQWLLIATDEAIVARHGRWYIADRNIDYIRRTALVVLGNIAEPTGPPVDELLRTYLRHDVALLRAHAVWAARRLGRDDLLAELTDDPAPEVQAEFGHNVEPRFHAADWDVS
jgi:epoxyqueuosine reductase